jgi:dTDP-4-amino-4,6-dideoxygalactose transaminase
MAIPFVDLALLHAPIQGEIDRAIAAVLADGQYVLGGALTAFERAFADACGVAHGVGMGCGTDAIALGLQALGIGPGQEVILPANTFVATLIGVVRAGATPILVDCDPETGLMDLDQTAAAMGDRTGAILPVHLYGQMVSPTALLDLVRDRGVILFEDAAQAHLAEREGYRAGSLGDGAAFSFFPSKNLGGFGDGGLFLTRHDSAAATARSLRNYGAPRKYYHADRGTNSRLDSIQAAVLAVKLPHLQHWNQQRNAAAATYDRLLAPLADAGITPLVNRSGGGHVYHLYPIRVRPCDRFDRDRLQSALESQGIATGIHYPIPCHRQPAYEDLGYGAGQFPHSEALAEQLLSLPMYPGITDAALEQVARAIAAVALG